MARRSKVTIPIPPNLSPPLPLTGWSLNTKGYVIYSSRCRSSGIKRGTLLHREVLSRLLGRPLTPDEVVHHQTSNKLHNCPHNLILMPECLNPSLSTRCPYTGRFLSREKWFRLYGVKGSGRGPVTVINPETNPDMPDWVTKDFKEEQLCC